MPEENQQQSQQTILGGAQPPAQQDGAPPQTHPAQQQPPAPAPSEWMADKDGVLSKDWRSRLPDGIRDAKCLDNIKSLSAMATSYVNAQRMVGANKIAVPGQNSSKEDWDAAYDALGRPKDASGYSLPEGIQWASAEQRDGVLRNFHEAGLSDRQAGAMIKLYTDLAAEAVRSQEAQRAKSDAELRSAWGFAYDENIRMANRALAGLGLVEVLQGNPALNDAGFIKAMAAAGRSMGETRLGGAGAGQPGRQGLQELMNDPAYRNASDPRHQMVMNQVLGLMAMNA